MLPRSGSSPATVNGTLTSCKVKVLFQSCQLCFKLFLMIWGSYAFSETQNIYYKQTSVYYNFFNIWSFGRQRSQVGLEKASLITCRLCSNIWMKCWAIWWVTIYAMNLIKWLWFFSPIISSRWKKLLRSWWATQWLQKSSRRHWALEWTLCKNWHSHCFLL